MTRLERRVFSRSLAIGALLTLMVLAAFAFGLLDSLEYWLYDQRAIHCQLAEAPPSSRFVHLDIDDASTAVTALGRWPWSRKQIAQILDEIQLAHPSAVGLDIMFAEPEKDPATGPNAKTTYSADDQLVRSLHRLGNTVLAASFKVESGESQSDGPPNAIDWLTNDLEMTPEEFANRLRQAGDKDTTGTVMEDLLSRLRRRAMKIRIENELAKHPANEDQLIQVLIPNVGSLDDGVGLTQLLHEEYSLAMAEHSVARFGSPLQTMDPPPLAGDLNVVPLSKFSDVAAECAFANYDIFDNATVRSIPLFVQYKNRLYPQIGLATACVMLGADPSAVRLEGSNLVIPTHGKPVVIPVFTYHSNALGRSIPLIAAVPWFGGRDWETMYDWPSHKTSARHVSIAAVWDICLWGQSLASNSRSIDRAIAIILDNKREDHLGTDPDLADKYAAALPAPDDIGAREAMVQKTVEALKQSPTWLLDSTPDKDLTANERFQKTQMRDALKALQELIPKSRHLHDKIESKRKWLNSEVAGKGILIGFTATGLQQDQVTTSLHLHCPGVVVHGVIVNAVLTNSWWKVVPEWVTVLITILLGMSAATIQGRFQPLRAGFFIFAILLGYLLINGYILFDWHKWIIGLAGPSVVLLVVWAGTTLDRVLVEGHERNRIALENAVISKEMDLARQVQVALIPTSAPKIVGIESEGWALTASVTGGDCYDLWQLKDGRLAILLADASGHGLAPAMIVSQVRTLARTLCDFETHPHGLLARINRRLADDLETTRFVTAFLGFLSPDGTLDWASAGHGPMYWTPTNSGEMIALDSTGMPLGIMPDCFLEDPQPSLKLGDQGSLIVFSDGIFEAHAPDGNMFGVERVKDILEKTNGQPCEPIINTLRTAVQKWQQKLEPEDDQTIVVVRHVVAT